MSEFDVDKFMAEMEAQDAAFEAQMKQLEKEIEEAARNTPAIVRATQELSGNELLSQLTMLLDAGADPNAQSPLGETALSVCFIADDFEAVKLLLERGASAEEFEWSDTHKAVLLRKALNLQSGAPEVMERDKAGRTPFLLACRAANLDAAKTLLPLTPAEGRSDHDGEGALMYAARSGDATVADWLLANGFAVDEEDAFGGTAFLTAVEADDVALARRLLEEGADLTKGRNISRENAARSSETTSVFGKIANSIMKGAANMMPEMAGFGDTILTPGQIARSPEMFALLSEYGLPLEDVDHEELPVFTGACRIPETKIAPETFFEDASPREGRSNPEKVDIPFWREQIRTGRSGWSAANDILGDTEACEDYQPVWSFYRFGRTGTRLPDGSWVLIAGEHEDHYDPDFCIYSDVTVIHPDATVDHYIYPADVFPPTDFHTATLFDDHILLIGSLSYQGMRHEGETQVLRLNLSDFSIERVETTGQNPGWISRHKALRDGQNIIVSGGKVEPGYRDNTDTYLLDLETLVWSRAT